MRIAICDDLKTERVEIINELNSFIQNISINEFDDGNELLKNHFILPYDLIILDIIMPKISGIKTAEILREKDTKTPIVFVSTSEEFGVLSYRVFAFDYLLKPLKKDQLKNTIYRLINNQNNKEKQYINITYKGIETKILLSNILCLESNLRKIKLTLLEDKEIEINAKLSDFDEHLIENGFCRCHKSFLVNLEHIDCINDNTFNLTNGKTVKISRTYLQSSKSAYFDYVFNSEGTK